MTHYQRDLLEAIGRLLNTSKLHFDRDFESAYTHDEVHVNEKDLQISSLRSRYYSPYFRGWLEGPLYDSFFLAFVNWLKSYIEDDACLDPERAKGFEAFRVIRDQIDADMKAHPEKYATSTGDIEW